MPAGPVAKSKSESRVAKLFHLFRSKSHIIQEQLGTREVEVEVEV